MSEKFNYQNKRLGHPAFAKLDKSNWNKTKDVRHVTEIKIGGKARK